MKSIRDYIAETERQTANPVTGDVVSFVINEELSIDCDVVEHGDDYIVLEADDVTEGVLTESRCTMERIARYGAVGNNRAVGFTTEGVMSEIDIDLHNIARSEDFDMLDDAFNGKMGGATQAWLENMFAKVAQHNRLHPDDQQEDILEIMMDQIVDDYGDGDFDPPEQMDEVSDPDMGTSPAPGKKGTETDAIRYNRSVGLDKEIGQYKDLPPTPATKADFQRTDKDITPLSHPDLFRQTLDRLKNLEMFKESYDPNKADAYNRAVKAGQSPAEAEKAAGITDRDINDYEIDVNGVMKKLQPTMPKPPAKDEVIDQYSHEWKRVMELAGVDTAASNDPLAAKAADLAPVSAQGDTQQVTSIDEDGVDPVNSAGQDAEELTGAMTAEAKYAGREVKLGKPMKGDVKKFKVFVKNPKTGKIKKVNFGDPNMEIRRDDPKRRKSFRARHGCGTARASDRTKAAYWSCRMWSKKPVSKIV